MASNQTVDMRDETRKGHREEMEYLLVIVSIIKTFKPGAGFD